MKKIFKSRIFIFMLGAVIFGSIGVYATSQIAASNVTYKEITVDRALDDLYSNISTKGPNLSNVKYNSVSNQERSEETTITLDLTKGKYVCSFSVSFGSVTSDSSYSAQSYSYYPNVSGCDTMTTIKANIRAVASSNSFLKNSSNTPYYSTSYNSLYTFICDVNTDKTISLTHITTANIYTANNAIINCIEIK